MSNHQTSKGLPNVISSAELEDGQEPCSSRGGVQIDLFGQEVLPANPSPQQVKDQGKTTSDISGLCSLISSESADLQQSLASRLQAQLDLDGLTIYKGTWKQKTTPQQRLYCQVVVSQPRTKGTDSSSWPTPAARDCKDTGDLDKSRYRKDGKERIDTVPRVAFGVERLSTAETGNTAPSQLNPRFSLWLMGYPIEWAYCAERVTRSSLKQQQKS